MGEPVDIVIPSYRDADYVRTLVASIRRTVPKGMARVIVADDASGAEHLAALAQIAGIEVVAGERLIPRALEIAASRSVAPIAYAQIKRALLAPVLTACDRRRETDRETWLESWFSEHAQTTLRAAVERITRR